MTHSSRRKRILIVDDSAVMRSLLRNVVSADKNLEVAGVAADGQSALREIETLRPDLVLLDVEMPVMDGLKTLSQLRARGHKMPVIMCSALTQRGAQVTIQALSSGASDYVAKPSGQSGPAAALRMLADELLPKIHALVSASMPPAGSSTSQRSSMLLPAAAAPGNLKLEPVATQPTVVVIGVSTGGPAALDVVLQSFPPGFPLPILIVQHMPEVFTRLLSEHLNQRCALRVCEAAEGDSVQPGSIYIARGNWHLEVIKPQAAISVSAHLTQTALVNHCRPAVDVLFRSAAAVYGAGVLAVVLTGMGSDGLAGSRAVRESGGCVLAQDQATSVVWGMPGMVTNAGLANSVLPLHAITPEILRIAGRTPREASKLRETIAS